MGRRRSDNIDSVMDSLNEWEKKQRGETASQSGSKVLVGTVEQFFDKISVAAVKLVSDLKVGDIIEIGDDEEAVRQKVSSMQINRKDVVLASEGDDVGIKMKHNVPVGSSVYRIGE